MMNEHDPAHVDEEPFSRWEDIKQRFIASFWDDLFKRHTFFVCVATWVGLLVYALLFK